METSRMFNRIERILTDSKHVMDKIKLRVDYYFPYLDDESNMHEEYLKKLNYIICVLESMLDNNIATYHKVLELELELKKIYEDFIWQD